MTDPIVRTATHAFFFNPPSGARPDDPRFERPADQTIIRKAAQKTALKLLERGLERGAQMAGGTAVGRGLGAAARCIEASAWPLLAGEALHAMGTAMVNVFGDTEGRSLLGRAYDARWYGDGHNYGVYAQLAGMGDDALRLHARELGDQFLEGVREARQFRLDYPDMYETLTKQVSEFHRAWEAGQVCALVDMPDVDGLASDKRFEAGYQAMRVALQKEQPWATELRPVATRFAAEGFRASADGDVDRARVGTDPFYAAGVRDHERAARGGVHGVEARAAEWNVRVPERVALPAAHIPG